MASVNVLKFECPCCFAKLHPPVYQCANGHLLCKVCIQTVKYDPCPTCKSPTVILSNDQAPLRIRNRQVEKIILDHQTHKCPWKGCCKRFKWGNLEDHKLGCVKRLGRFCTWLKIAKCEKEVPLAGLLDHLEKEHGGARHQQGQNGASESVEFKAKFPAEMHARSSMKIFMCWIRGQDNDGHGGDRECFPFFLVVTYGASNVYWKPFIIASKAMMDDEPFRCEISMYPDLKTQDSGMMSYTRPSIIHYLQDNKWDINESCCENIAHFRRILLTSMGRDEELKDNSSIQSDGEDEYDDDEEADEDEDDVEDEHHEEDSHDENDEDDDPEIDDRDGDNQQSNSATAGGSTITNSSSNDNNSVLTYFIRVSFRDMKTRRLYKFQAQDDYHMTSAPGASSFSSVTKPCLQEAAKPAPTPGTSTTTISKACPK